MFCSALAAHDVVHEWSSQVKCWQIRRQTKAPQAAGAIHSDFERGFICAEVCLFSHSNCLELNRIIIDKRVWIFIKGVQSHNIIFCQLEWCRTLFSLLKF